jgi:hypothetical protein
MTITAETFVRDKPEFESAGEALVTATIALAAPRVSADQYGDAYDDAHTLMTAHLLWDSPFGASMRRDGGTDAESPYVTELKALRLERVPRMMVL